MINSIQIKNFKSVVDLTLEVGSFNVLIGENGCGKSNILEAIGFGAAASADKLDFEFLGSRGIRLTKPEFMFSAFPSNKPDNKISLMFKDNESLFKHFTFLLSLDEKKSKKWTNLSKDVLGKSTGDFLSDILFNKKKEEKEKELKKIFTENEEILKFYLDLADEIKKTVKKSGKKSEASTFFSFTFNQFLKDRYTDEKISSYILYSPDQDSLRKFEETNQIYPLGIKGQGLFQYLKELSSNPENKELFTEIKDVLYLLDWYDDFELPENLLSNEYSLNIRDKYLDESLKSFDQKSTNEGFLFLLFYAVLFSSKDTPTFFAIDNIDVSFNPKLCTELVKKLAALAAKHGKQVIVTTHNPAILDGLDLEDGSQRLFVIRRNDEGHTKARRIEYRADRTMKLSELWTNGLIGGLPDNF